MNLETDENMPFNFIMEYAKSEASQLMDMNDCQTILKEKTVHCQLLQDLHDNFD